MIILSWDVGVIHLAYCILDGRKILDWDLLNLTNLIGIKKHHTNKVCRIPTQQLQLELLKRLHELEDHFNRLGIEYVLIENQPSIKNPKMKAIAATLLDYFLVRFYLDGVYHLKGVYYTSPSGRIRMVGGNHNSYHKRKKQAIIVTRELLRDQPEQLEYLQLFTKQDDLCDAYLSGIYYLKTMEHKI